MALLVWFCCFSGPGTETHQRPRCIWCRSEPHCPGGLTIMGYSPAPLFAPTLRVSNPHDQQHARGGEFRGGSEPHEQRYARERKVTLRARSLFSQFCPLLGTRGFAPWWPSAPGSSSLLCSCRSVYHSFLKDRTYWLFWFILSKWSTISLCLYLISLLEPVYLGSLDLNGDSQRADTPNLLHIYLPYWFSSCSLTERVLYCLCAIHYLSVWWGQRWFGATSGFET